MVLETVSTSYRGWFPGTIRGPSDEIVILPYDFRIERDIWVIEINGKVLRQDPAGPPRIHNTDTGELIATGPFIIEIQ